MSDTDFDDDNLFGDLDIASANDNPFFKEDGNYPCLVTGAVMRISKKNGSKGWAIDYTIQEPNPKKGQRIQEWKNVPWPWQVKGYETKEDMENETGQNSEIAARAARDISFLKVRLREFGIPEEHMNKVRAEDILNLGLLMVTIFNKDGQERISGVALASEEDQGDVDPFA